MTDDVKPLGDTLRRAQLITRLSAAAGFLRGARMADSGDAVLEAIEILRELPIAEYVHKALQPDAMSTEDFKFHNGSLRTVQGGLRAVKGRLDEFDRLFPIVNGQTLKPVAEERDYSEEDDERNDDRDDVRRPGVTIVRGMPDQATLDSMNASTNAWFMRAARGECGWVCPDCTQSFPKGMPDKCEHGHQSCTDCITRDKQAAQGDDHEGSTPD